MRNTNIAPSTRPAAARLSTESAAARLFLRPQTLRAALCRSGHFMGMIPIKLPNGRLLWDADAVERLLSGEVAK
ncbi:MAG: hypothetical protein AW08_03911 [Candidatus Accumulibacter adjunctus]|uniref:DNA-binding protein n=1 Tax=Candidatus Accumulibacter adjunctus TaxID=1454001 RepID=A0A011PBJ2_9PROT|nr:MAG: hypothetical protein AW08_03911 [Candidatus Accumulibacter adjunctus]